LESRGQNPIAGHAKGNKATTYKEFVRRPHLEGNLFPSRCHYSKRAMSIEEDSEIVAFVLARDKAAFGTLIE
jgi:hypothetical protein